MAFSSDVISIEKNGAVATVWLDRAEKFNALSTEVWSAIPLALNEVVADGEMRAIIFSHTRKIQPRLWTKN